MRFVKLTLTNGNKVFINLQHVIRLVEEEQKTWIFTIDQNTFYVKETPEDILIKLPVIGG